MKRISLFVGLGLTLMLLFSAAFKWSNDKVAADNRASGTLGTRTLTTGGLKLGEYACYGSGGSLLIGLGFKVLADNEYTDLDAKEHGTFVIKDDTVTFKGGHLDGQVGTGLHDYKFNIHSVSCEPYK